MTDRISLLLKRKRSDRHTIIKALAAAPPKGRRTWAKWLEQNAVECAALEQVQNVLVGLRAVKLAAKSN